MLDLSCPPGNIVSFVYVMAGREARTGRGIDDQQDRGHQREEQDRGSEDSSRGPTLDQGSDEDSTNTLSSLVDSLSSAH